MTKFFAFIALFLCTAFSSFGQESVTCSVTKIHFGTYSESSQTYDWAEIPIQGSINATIANGVISMDNGAQTTVTLGEIILDNYLNGYHQIMRHGWDKDGTAIRVKVIEYDESLELMLFYDDYALSFILEP